MKQNQELNICENCGKTVRPGEGGEHEGAVYCEDCYKEMFFTCSYCGEVKEIIDSEEDANGNNICKDCIDNYFYHCDECGELIDADEGDYYFTDDVILCEECGEELLVYCVNDDAHHLEENCTYNEYQDIWIWDYGHYDVCDVCGAMYIDELLDHRHPEQYICGECLDAGEGTSLERLLLPYHSGSSTKRLNTKGYGIELEVAHINNAARFKEICENQNILTELTGDYESAIKAEADGSLDEGAEFISSIMTPAQVLDYFIPLLEELQGVCISHNYESGAGIHINISYDLFKDEYHLRRFIYLLQTNAKFFYKFSRRSEDQKRWSRLFTKEEIFRRTGDKTKRTIAHAYKGNGKYSAFNFKESCLEVRQIRGTLNINTFKATIFFISDLVEFSRYESNYNKFELFVETEAARHPEINRYLEERGLI